MIWGYPYFWKHPSIRHSGYTKSCAIHLVASHRPLQSRDRSESSPSRQVWVQIETPAPERTATIWDKHKQVTPHYFITISNSISATFCDSNKKYRKMMNKYVCLLDSGFNIFKSCGRTRDKRDKNTQNIMK